MNEGQTRHQQRPSTLSRRLRQTTRLDYQESSDESSPAPLISTQSTFSQPDSQASVRYEVRQILNRRRNSTGIVEYLVDWADNSLTGEQYSPSWQPKGNLDSDLEAEWLLTHQSDSELNDSASTTRHRIWHSDTKKASNKNFLRARRVIDSSPSTPVVITSQAEDTVSPYFQPSSPCARQPDSHPPRSTSVSPRLSDKAERFSSYHIFGLADSHHQSTNHTTSNSIQKDSSFESINHLTNLKESDRSLFDAINALQGCAQPEPNSNIVTPDQIRLSFNHHRQKHQKFSPSAVIPDSQPSQFFDSIRQSSGKLISQSTLKSKRHIPRKRYRIESSPDNSPAGYNPPSLLAEDQKFIPTSVIHTERSHITVSVQPDPSQAFNSELEQVSAGFIDINTSITESESTCGNPAALLDSLATLSQELAGLPQSTNPVITDNNSEPEKVSFVAESVSPQNSMPETRRSNRPSGSTTTTSQQDGDASNTTSSGPRKSLRGIRKDIEAKRLQVKARNQLNAEQRRNGTDSNNRSPDSELGPSTTSSQPQGRGRKRVEGLDDRNAKSPSDTKSIEANSKTSTDSHLGISGPRLSSMEFIVPLPLIAQASDQYRRTVVFYKDLIESFTAVANPPPAQAEEAEKFVTLMRNLCMHVDLANQTTSPGDALSPTQQMTWDRSISSKFAVLGDICNLLKTEDRHIVVFAQAGAVLDMVEIFIRGNNLNMSRPDKQTEHKNSYTDQPISLTLLPSTNYETHLPSRNADLVILLDHLMDVDKPVLRDLRSSGSYLAPAISLIVLNAVDHVERYMVERWTDQDRLQAEVACIAKLRSHSGRLDTEFQRIDEIAPLIAEFVINRLGEDEWPIVPIGPLADNEAHDLAMGHTVLMHRAVQDAEPSRKRSRDSSQDDTMQNNKKARRVEQAPAPIQEEQDTSISRISESMLSQQLSERTQKFIKTEGTLKAQVRELKEAYRKKDILARDMEKDLDFQLGRYEKLSREAMTQTKRLEETNRKLEEAGVLRQRRDETISVLKDENRQLKDDLEQARKVLENSTIPEIAEITRLQKEKDEVVAAQAKAMKEVQNANQLSGYLQAQYQDASTNAAELAHQNTELESRVKELERKASGEAVKLRQMTLDNKHRMTVDEMNRLKQELKNVKIILQKKEEELKAKRSGIGTRAGSVPRSPRVGPSSRASSPIPDRRIESLRHNGATFSGRKGKNNPRNHDPDSPRNTKSRKKDDSTSETRAPRSSARDKDASANAQKEQLEIKTQDDKSANSQLPDIQPAQPIRSPAVEMKMGTLTSRPFPCCFAPYNCGASFTSKNEWKRHISTKHIQLGFWRCDMCTPSPGLDHPVFNDFNRKDLFTQHLRRMHAPNAPITIGPHATVIPPAPSSQPSTPNQGTPKDPMESLASPLNTAMPTPGNQLSDEQILDIQKRCYRILRQPPQQSSCVFCNRLFTGPNSWEERLEHVGGHLERDRKNGTNCLDIASWREDEDLKQYLLREGIVEQDSRGNWRIGDGRPRRPTELLPPTPNPPSTTPGASQQSSGNANDGESDGSMSKRRRGRPPKRYSDVDTPPHRLAPNMGTPGNPEVRPREHHALQPAPPHTPGLHPTSEMRGPPLQTRMDSAPATPVSGPTSAQPRLEPYPPSPHHQHGPPPGPPQGPPHYPQEMSATSPHAPPSRPPQLLPNIMPRTPQSGGAGSPLSPFAPQHPHHMGGQQPIAIAPAYHNHPGNHHPGMQQIAPAPGHQGHHGPGQMPAAIMGPNGPVAMSQAMQQQFIAAQAMQMNSTANGPHHQQIAPAPPASASPPLGVPLAPAPQNHQSQGQFSQGPLAPRPQGPTAEHPQHHAGQHMGPLSAQEEEAQRHKGRSFREVIFER